MKQKDIEKKIKNESDRYTPNLLDKIKTAARSENLLPYDSDLNLKVAEQGNTAVIAKNKRKAVWMFSAFASCILCLILVLTIVLNFGRAADSIPLSPPHTNLSTKDVYGMGAVSSVRLLGSAMPAEAIKAFSTVNTIVYAAENNTLTTASDDEVKGQAKRFNEYFTALDSFLGDDIVSTVTENNTDSRYDYATKMTVSGKDINGKTVQYTMYYTETLYTHADADVDEEDEEDDEDDEEAESKYRLIGVMVIDGMDYHLEGERSEETETDETETELKIRAYADINDKTSFVQMEQEYSVEDGETETEYVYSIYVNGELIEQTAVEFENEIKNNKVETEYELEFRSGTSKGKYIVEREVKDSKTSIKVTYNINGKTGVFHIREIKDQNGNKKYQYIFYDNDIMVF